MQSSDEFRRENENVCPLPRHCEERSRRLRPPKRTCAKAEAIQSRVRGSRLLRGACHRAGQKADPLAGDDSGASCCLTAESETERVPQAALTAFAFTGGIARKEIASLFQALMVAISMVRFTVSASENCVRTS